MTDKINKMLDTFKNYKYQGIHISAIKRENKVIKKITAPLKEDYENKFHYFEKIKNKKYPLWVGKLPNAIQIETNNITVIDIDQPDKFDILEDALNDCNFIIKTNKGYHLYFNDCKNILSSKNGCRDGKYQIFDINLPKMFFCPEYIDKETGEIYKYEVIKNNELNDIPKYLYVYLNSIIKQSYNNKDTVYKTYEKKERQIIYDFNIKIEKFDLLTIDNILNIYHKHGLLNSYESWKNTAYAIKHLNNSLESFKLFHKYSQKSKKYKDEKDCFKTFYSPNYDVNFDTTAILIRCSKLDIDLYSKNLLNLYKSKIDENYNYKINTQYIYTDENKHIFNDWFNNYKCLMVKSAYGTGKTYAFKKLIDDYPFKKILFITYRQSLAYSLSNDLCENYNFKCYLDKTVNLNTEDRLIIQLDSIKYLSSNFNYETQEEIFNKYDLIVLDEIEGLLNHFSYEKLNQFEIYNKLEKLIITSNKVLCLDGDLDDRAFTTIHNILPNNYKIVINEYKPNKKHFIFTSDLNKFHNDIEQDLQNKKKIVVVCMTKAETKVLYDKFNNKYKCMIHNSDEKNKEVLLDVNKNWIKYDLIIYSPVIEAGVDFNIKNNFFKCYAYLSNSSTSYRAFCQMLNRVRDYQDNNILCYYDSLRMKYNFTMNPYIYEDFRLTKYRELEINNLLNILIYNDIETYQSINYFIPSLLKLLNNKGHTFIEYTEEKVIDESDDNNMSEKGKMIINISNAKNITLLEYEYILNKQRNNKDITKDEKYSLLKYYYKRVFLIDDINDINEDFLETHYNNISTLKNNKLLHINNRYLDENNYLKKFKFDKIDTITNIIKCLKLDVFSKDIEINDEQLESGKDKILEIINSKEYKILFNIPKARNIIKNKLSLNNLLKPYGLKIMSIRNRKQINKVNIDTYTYKLINLDYIEQYYNRIKILNDKYDHLGNDLDVFLEIDNS